MSGLTSGIMSGAGSAIAAARSIANRVTATIRSAMKIHSPSRVMMEIGEFISEGLGVGMLDMINYLVKSASQVADSVTEAMTPQAPNLDFINGFKREYATAVANQSADMDSTITANGRIIDNGLSSDINEAQRRIDEVELTKHKTYVHNEIIGDRIQTTVDEIRGRKENKANYFGGGLSGRAIN